MSKFKTVLLTGLTGVIIMCANSIVTEQALSDPLQIRTLLDKGEYAAATRAIQSTLADPDLTPAVRKAYLFEIERINRIRKDFQATYDEVFNFIQDIYPEVTEADIQRWEESKALEFKLIDGEKLYFNRAARNLFRIDPLMREVWEKQHPGAEITSGSGIKMDLDRHNASIIKAALSTHNSYVVPKRLRIKQSVKVKPNRVPAGETVKCWIPYPRHIEGRQEDIVLFQSHPERSTIAPEEVLQRTIYMEAEAVANQPLIFSVEYELTSHGIFHNIKEDSVRQLKPDQDIEEYLREAEPHIVFTPELRALSRSIVGDEENPYRKAQLLFAWVDNNIPWASAREYSTIKCIPQYAYENGHGDCGIQTLLFMTLCRMNGIPARWQSGWELQPPHDSMHDWGMIYFEPYGWVPMDVTYGQRKIDDPRLKWFYLGGMDSYRIIFNDAYAQAFIPEKEHFRSETIDSQRGEVEWSGGNLYFDEWTWDFDWEVLE